MELILTTDGYFKRSTITKHFGISYKLAATIGVTSVWDYKVRWYPATLCS